MQTTQHTHGIPALGFGGTGLRRALIYPLLGLLVLTAYAQAPAEPARRTETAGHSTFTHTAVGGRGVPGAGKLIYLANGHDLRAFECPATRQLWTNSVRWLLS